MTGEHLDRFDAGLKEVPAEDKDGDDFAKTPIRQLNQRKTHFP
jgi:hypothetical protein